MSRSSVLGIAMATALLAGPVALGDTSQSVTVPDEVGDTTVKDAPAYQDIIEAEVTKVIPEQGEPYFIFREGLAGAVTRDSPFPSHPGGVKHILWDFGIGTSEPPFPSGYPFAGNGNRRNEDYLVWLDWDGECFRGVLVDRTPLRRGEPAKLSSVDFALCGADVLLFVPAALLPDEFVWACGTVSVMCANIGFNPGEDLHAGGNAADLNGTEGYLGVDGAGFPGTPFP